MTKFSKLALGASALVVASALLSGCAQIPHDGQIGIGPNIQGSVAGDYFYYSPSLPTPGMASQDVITGFLSAGTGPQNDYTVARKYLTEGLRSSWSPNDGVLIEHGSPTIQIDSQGAATVKIQVEGEVTADGHYVAHPDLPARTLNYQLTKDSGEWRISSAPNLTVLLRPNFDVLFRGYSLYFFDQNYRHLVPDLRWFPARPSTATRLVNALLAGPSKWLLPGTVSAFPTSTHLSIDSVTITGGNANVDLSSQIFKASVDHKLYLQAQLWATLKQLPNVLSMTLLVDHVEQQIITYDPSEPTKVSNDPVELTVGGLSHTSLSGSKAITGAAGIPADATDFSLSRDESWLALSTPGGTKLATLNGLGLKPITVDARKHLLGPAYDSNGYFWSVPISSTANIRAFNDLNNGKDVASPALNGYKRLAASISPEGSRIALILKRGGASRLAVASIFRDSNGAPKSLGEPEFLATDLHPTNSISWLDSNSVAVLSSDLGGKRVPVVVTIGGTERRLPSVDGAVSIATGNEAGDIYLRLKTGYLEVFQGTGWAAISSLSKALHFPGS
jgi:hypothetical protein